MSPLAYVGAAYAWRLTATVRRLADKIDSLERSSNAR